MKYFDKSSGREVELKESSDQFLALISESESENLISVGGLKTLSATRSRNKDDVVILQVASDAEDVHTNLASLKKDGRVRDVAPALIDAGGQVRYVLPGRVVVQVRGLDDARALALFQGLGSRVVRRFRSAGLYEVGVPAGGDLGGFIAALNRRDEVKYAEPSFYGVHDSDVRVRTTVARFGSVPAGRFAAEAEALAPPGLPWNITRIAADQVWATTRGTPAVVVAVVDEPPQIDHEALAAKFLLPDDDAFYFTGDREPSSHGTHVCGVVAGEGTMITGVAPGARILPLAINLETQSYVERADAIRYAAELAAGRQISGHAFQRMVLSCSWRTSGDVASVRNAIEEAVASGIPVLFSAGNDGTSGPHFPSDYSGQGGARRGRVLRRRHRPGRRQGRLLQLLAERRRRCTGRTRAPDRPPGCPLRRPGELLCLHRRHVDRHPARRRARRAGAQPQPRPLARRPEAGHPGRGRPGHLPGPRPAGRARHRPGQRRQGDHWPRDACRRRTGDARPWQHPARRFGVGLRPRRGPAPPP